MSEQDAVVFCKQCKQLQKAVMVQGEHGKHGEWLRACRICQDPKQAVEATPAMAYMREEIHRKIDDVWLFVGWLIERCESLEMVAGIKPRGAPYPMSWKGATSEYDARRTFPREPRDED